MSGSLTPDSLQSITSPDDVAALFQQLGYTATAQPIAVEDLELPTRSAQAIQDAYLLADYKQGNYTLQILLFQLYPDEFSSFSVVRNRMRMIANSLCNRPAHYLLVATKDYKQLFLSSPHKTLDEQLNLVVSLEACLINLESPSFQDRNWLKKIAASGLSLEFLHKTHQKTLKDAYEIQLAQGKESFTTDSIQVYLREIGRIKLLCTHEEIELARKVKRYQELEQVREQLKQQLGRLPTNREWAAATTIPLLAFQIGRKAKQKLIAANLRLVVSIAKRYLNRGVEFQDLIQEGNIGLIRATEKFDPERGYRFSTYATWWIRQGITRAICLYSRTIRLPVHLYETQSKVKKAVHGLSQQKNRTPTIGEIAEFTGIEPEKLRKMNEDFQSTVSIDMQVGSEGGFTIGELIEASAETPLEYIEKLLIREEIGTLLENLKPRDADIMRQRFGLGSGSSKTLEEIAQPLGLTRERVRQIEAKSLQKLRNVIKAEMVKKKFFAF